MWLKSYERIVEGFSLSYLFCFNLASYLLFLANHLVKLAQSL
jgi:hypothetical protein